MIPSWRLKRRRSSPQAARFIELRLRGVELRYPPDAAAGGAVRFAHFDETGKEIGEPAAIVLMPDDVGAIERDDLVGVLGRLLERDLDVYPDDVVATERLGHVPPPRQPTPEPPLGPTPGRPGDFGLGKLG